MNERARVYRLKHPEWVKEKNEYYRNKNKVQKAEYDRLYKVRNGPELRNKKLLRTYGISSEEYRQRLEAQDGKCAICRRSETSRLNGNIRALAVDHCHKTGKVRGLLCGKCNLAIGQMGDSQELLSKALRYLKKANEIPGDDSH